MHTNESAENYLETILILSKQRPVVRAVDIAAELDFKKSSVSVAMKKLREGGQIEVSPEGYITLTESGREIECLACPAGGGPEDSRGGRLPHRACDQRREF